MPKYKELVIGIDQSYKNAGISISADGRLLKVSSIRLSKLDSNSNRRKHLRKKLDHILRQVIPKAQNTVCVIERIRLRSEGFINMDYIKAIGALNAVIVDVCGDYSVPVYSVDTRCWKSQVVGSSKPAKNKMGVPPEKWPTVKWAIAKGFEQSILVEITTNKKKGTFVRNGKRYQYNDDAADSAAISMFWFVGESEKLKEER